MSLTKRMEKKRELKLQRYEESLAAKTGILFFSNLTADDDSFPFMKYIVNALALFCAAFGSLNCFVTAFELEMSIAPLVITCIVFSLLLSFMYVSFKAKIITYIGIFLGILICSTRYYIVVNSGICALRNNCLKFIDIKVGLPFLREFSVLFEDEYVAMSIAICVLAVVLLIFLNIFISERMNLSALFAMTFPIVQFGMYFNFETSKLSMFCVLTSWMLVAAIKFSGAYNGLTRKYVSTASVKKNKHSYGFVTDSKNVANIAVVWLAFIITVTGVFFAVMPTDTFELSLPTDSAKTSTERVVKNFLSYGVNALFSSDKRATESGQLSNISDISFDGRTDLRVTMVDYYVERVYLRSYAGYQYDSKALKWINKEDEENAAEKFNFTAELLKNDFDTNKIASKSRHKIGVQTVDSTQLLFPLNVPYYSLTSGYEYQSESSIDTSQPSKETQYYDVYTLDASADYEKLLENNSDDFDRARLTETEKAMREKAYSEALEVPEINLEAVRAFCNTYGIKAGDKNAVSKVINALQEDFDYTLRPGKVPYGEDYVNYFLLANQKGYCQHFASAATLIFRYLGVPARYAEGYVVDVMDFFRAKDLPDEKLEDWIDSPIEHGRSVVEVDLADDNGHAWVEVYYDGLGWVPVEVTVAAPIDDGEQGFFARLFSGSNALNLTDQSQSLAQAVRRINREKTEVNLKILVIVASVCLALMYILRMIIKVIRRRNVFEKSSRGRLNAGYTMAYEAYFYLHRAEKRNLSYIEFFDLLFNEGLLKEPFCEELEKALFGKAAYDEKALIKRLSSLRRAIISEMGIFRKFRYYFVDIMW